MNYTQLNGHNDLDGLPWPGPDRWLNNETACDFPRHWRQPDNVSLAWTPRKDSIFHQRSRSMRQFDDYYEGIYLHPGFGRITITTESGELTFKYYKVRDGAIFVCQLRLPFCVTQH